jgi:hypothetical protein
MAFFNGPLNKTIYTQEFELFAKCLLASPDAVKFGYQEEAGKKQLYGYLGNETPVAVNISKLLTKTDFTHVQLSEADGKAYQIQYAGGFNGHSNYESGKQDLYSNRPALTHAEKCAIQNYTGLGYSAINRLMYKNGAHYGSKGSEILYENPALYVLKTLLISSGLNKIMPDTNSDQHNIYRGEHATSAEQIQERIHSIELPDSFVQTPAYMSISADPSVASRFSGSVMIKFEGLYGKHIESISTMRSEQEYLLQPAKIQWTGHEEKTISLPYSRHGTKTVHEFTAKVVNPLIQEEQTPNFQDIAEFKKIVEWAQKNNIDTDFITTHNKAMYGLDDALPPAAFMLPDPLQQVQLLAESTPVLL